MNKLKKAVSDLREHLYKFRDKTAVELLTAIERVANDVRKQAAVEKENAEYTLRQKATAVAALREAEAELNQLRDQLRSEQAARQQADRDVAMWQGKLAEIEAARLREFGPDFEESPEDLKQRGLDLARVFSASVSTLRRWRRKFPNPPRFVDKDETHTGFGEYDLHVLFPNLSVNDFTTLGRFVAVMAMANLPCIFKSSWVIQHELGHGNPRLAAFRRWLYKRNNDLNLDKEIFFGDFQVIVEKVPDDELEPASLVDRRDVADQAIGCCLCGNLMAGYGNSAWPASFVANARSCDNCYSTKVMPARAKAAGDRARKKLALAKLTIDDMRVLGLEYPRDPIEPPRRTRALNQTNS